MALTRMRAAARSTSGPKRIETDENGGNGEITGVTPAHPVSAVTKELPQTPVRAPVTKQPHTSAAHTRSLRAGRPRENRSFCGSCGSFGNFGSIGIGSGAYLQTPGVPTFSHLMISQNSQGSQSSHSSHVGSLSRSVAPHTRQRPRPVRGTGGYSSTARLSATLEPLNR